MKVLHQVLAIARTEWRFTLRRGAAVVVTAVVGLVIGAGILLGPISNLEGWAEATGDPTPETLAMLTDLNITVDEYQNFSRNLFADLTATGTPGAWFLALLALLLLPVATASAIPADRKFGTLELLRSTPLTGGTYLAGKLLGTAGSVTIIGLLPLALFFLVLEGVFRVGVHAGMPAYLAGFFLKLAILDGLPIFACGACLGVLVGMGLPNRRAAIFPGFLAGAISLPLWLKAFQAPPVQFSTPDLASYFVYQGYHSLAQATFRKMTGDPASLPGMAIVGEGNPMLGLGNLLLMYGSIAAFLLLLAAISRGWLHWKENF